MKLTRELMLEIRNKLNQAVKEQTQYDEVDSLVIDFEGDIQVSLLNTGDVLIFNPKEL